MTNRETPSGFRARLRGFGPLGLLAIVLIFAGNFIVVPLSAILVLLWAWASGTPWRDIGYVRPKSWIGGLVIGGLSGAAFKLAMKAVVMPLLGAPPVNEAFHYLAHNTSAVIPFSLYAVIIGAGFGEETVFRGWMFERLGKLFGHGFGAKTAIVLLTSSYFGVLHFAQGLAGVEQAAIVGVVYGSIFAVTGRIWVLMCAHAVFDLVAVALIYFDVEEKVAHLVFH